MSTQSGKTDISSYGLAGVDRIALIFGMAVCAAIVVNLLGAGFNPLKPSYYLSNLQVYAAAWVFVLGMMLLVALVRVRPKSPIAYTLHEFFGHERRRDVWRALLYSILLSVFGTLFSLSKHSIPLFNDYSWDPTFIAWDRAIYGTDAWLVLQPILGFPAMTWAVGWLYQLWVLLIYIGNFYFAFFERDPQIRARFVCAYILTWTLVGFVAASAFASVGPVFVGPILGIDHFAPQMAYLREANEHFSINILSIQDNLLEWYRDDTATLGAGISAMPSMHVAQAFLIFLAMLRKPAWVAAASGIFAVIIMFGSVHLALHYAVDGYVSIVLTTIIWVSTGAFFRFIASRRRETRRAPPAAIAAEETA